MGRRSDYRKDRAWDSWDMNCRRICPVDSPSRRKLRDILRRQHRKRIGRELLQKWNQDYLNAVKKRLCDLMGGRADDC